MRKVIDLDRLQELVLQGHSQTKIAKMLGVSRHSVVRGCKKLKESVTRVTAMEEAHVVVHKSLNIHDDLVMINNATKEILTRVTSQPNKEKEIGRAADAMIMYKEDKEKQHLYLNLAYERLFKDDQRALQAVDQIRKQLESQLKILQAMFDIQEIASFQEEVLESIGEVDEETKRRIVERLNERRAIRATFNTTPPRARHRTKRGDKV